MIKLLVKNTQLDQLQANLESTFSVKDTRKGSILTMFLVRKEMVSELRHIMLSMANAETIS